MSLQRVNELRRELKRRGITVPRGTKLPELERLARGKSKTKTSSKTSSKKTKKRAGLTADEFRWGWHSF